MTQLAANALSVHRDRLRNAAVVALLLAVALVPLWSVDIPPLTDYHNHLARQYILANLPRSEYLQAFYQADWKLAPYLAMDAVVQGLAGFVSVDLAGRIFLSMAFLLTASAPIALSLALFGRVTPFALLGLLTIHNQALSLGFVHYLFSVGFALCLLALWIRLREGRPWVRLTVFPVLVTLLFFSHLIGFAIYALTVGAYELSRHVDEVRRRTPRAPLSLDRIQRLDLLSLSLQCLLPLGLFVLFGPPATTLGQNTHGGLARKFGLLADSVPYLIPPYLWTQDRILAVALPAALLLLAAMRKLAVAKRMVWPLLAMLLLFFAMPWNLLGGFGADHRMLPAIALLLAGSLTWKAARDTRRRIPGAARSQPTDATRDLARRWDAFAFALVAGLVAVRTAAITTEWRAADREYAEYVRGFESLTDGSRMYYAFGHAGSAKQGHLTTYSVPCLAVASRHVYVPYLFTSSASHPGITMRYTANYEPLERLSPGPRLVYGQSPDWNAILDKYDFFLLGNERFFDTPVPGQLVPVYKGTAFTLYRHPAAGPRSTTARAGG